MGTLRVKYLYRHQFHTWFQAFWVKNFFLLYPTVFEPYRATLFLSIDFAQIPSLSPSDRIARPTADSFPIRTNDWRSNGEVFKFGVRAEWAGWSRQVLTQIWPCEKRDICAEKMEKGDPWLTPNIRSYHTPGPPDSFPTHTTDWRSNKEVFQLAVRP